MYRQIFNANTGNAIKTIEVFLAFTKKVTLSMLINSWKFLTKIWKLKAELSLKFKVMSFEIRLRHLADQNTFQF